MKILSTIALGVFALLTLNAQKSIHQEQLEYYNSLGNATADYYEANTQAASMPPKEKSNCNLNKVTYGWHPYWIGNAYQNYDWDLLSHFSFFSYEVDAATGNANSTHGWSTSAAVDAALASGNTKVTLCATLFSGHNTFFGSATAQQTFITNIINLVQSRGAHGVQIDFEGLPSGQRTNFANFMVDLCTQMHSAIPGSEVSTVLYAVDWNNVFDFSIMEPHVDHYIIMGYAYYYQGSSNTGPCDPLYHFGSSYNYSLSRSTSYYLDLGCPREKYILGLPYYGYEWPTTSLSIPSATTGSGSARTYAVVKNNSSGNYSAANYQYDQDSYTDMWSFNNGQNRNTMITLEDGFRKRLEFAELAGIGGMGIWALGYDDGYSQLWDAMREYMTDCHQDSCTGQIHDFGGPYKNYYNDEDYTFTIDPPGATSLTFDFTEFDVELNYDYLYIYDGSDDSAPQIPGSPFTGTVSPGTITSSTGAMTFKFTSDGATTSPGFIANWTCTQDNTPPTTNVTTSGQWETADFQANFTDSDNDAVAAGFYHVYDNGGTENRSNTNLGWVHEEFQNTTLNTDWTNHTGTWTPSAGVLNQTDEAESNTNLSINVNQIGTEAYLYHWTGSISGSGTNRRAGMHIYCDDPTQTNRGNSYLVYWRADNNKCQIYKCAGNSINIETDDAVTVNAGQNYDFKIWYDPTTGVIKAYLDDMLVSQWTDSSPLTTANSISLRTGNCIGTYDDLMVYRSRGASETITIGNANAAIRYQNPSPNIPSGFISSINVDESDNWSTVATQFVDVDWTAPDSVDVFDGTSADIDVFSDATTISGNWDFAVDPHSGVISYDYAVGTAPYFDDIVSWTNTTSGTSFTETGLNLINGQTYYVSVKSNNSAGLTSPTTVSNGQELNLISSINEDVTGVKVYPNPATDFLTIDGAIQGGELKILDASGRVVFSNYPQSNSSTLSLDGFASGQYMLLLNKQGHESKVWFNISR